MKLKEIDTKFKQKQIEHLLLFISERYWTNQYSKILYVYFQHFIFSFINYELVQESNGLWFNHVIWTTDTGYLNSSSFLTNNWPPRRTLPTEKPYTQSTAFQDQSEIFQMGFQVCMGFSYLVNVINKRYTPPHLSGGYRITIISPNLKGNEIFIPEVHLRFEPLAKQRFARV